MSARAAAVALAVAAALAGAAPAAAQSTRYPPPPEDLDAEREQESPFWEDVLEPGLARYEEQVDRAAQLIVRRAHEARTTAIALLEEAAALLPGRADAWAWLGIVREQDRDYPGCAADYARAWAIDPAWDGSGDRAAPRPLALGLGTCLARTGDLDDAAAALERLIALGEARTEAYFRLGEVYLAQERLDDATAVLDVALDGSPAETFYVHAAWAMVVAADRARDPARLERAAQLALARDAQLGHVGQPPGGFVPATERDYYLGLATLLAGQPERALIHLRAFAAAHDGAWRGRALERAEEAAGFRAADRVVVEQTDTLDAAAVTRAMTKIEPAARACLKETPRLLVSVRATRYGPPLEPAPPDKGAKGAQGAGATKDARGTGAARGKGARGGKPKAKPAPAKPTTGRRGGPIGGRIPPPEGVGVSMLLVGYEPDGAAAAAAVDCVERAAAKLQLPAPTTAGTWVTATMPVVWR